MIKQIKNNTGLTTLHEALDNFEKETRDCRGTDHIEHKRYYNGIIYAIERIREMLEALEL